MDNIVSKTACAMDIFPLGETAVRIVLGDRIHPEIHRHVDMFAKCLDRNGFPGMIEYVPSYCAITVFYQPEIVAGAASADDRLHDRSASDIVAAWLRQMGALANGNEPERPVTVEIPVCYGGSFGPDLEAVAAYHRMSADEVISVHSGGEYLVYMIGFAPGFPYLGGLPERIATPRRPTPRVSVPPGSVGIGGSQTGIYPISTPGGWHLIGRTPAALFRPELQPPSLLQAGNIVKFRPISPEEYEAYEEGVI